SGIGTFYHSFSQNKPVSFNQDMLWQIRYDRGGNHLFEIMATMGILGFLSYLFILITNFKNFFSQKDQSKSMLLFIPFLALTFAQLIFYQNTTLIFLFWFMMAILEISFENKEKEEFSFSFGDIPEMKLILKMISVVLVLIILGTFYFLGKAYYADILYDKGANMPDGQDRINLLDEAIKWNPKLVQYMISASRANFTQSWIEINQAVNQEAASALFQQRIVKSIDIAKRATEVSPNHVVAWETLGMIYREINSMAGGEALDWGLKSFQTALELDPNNPVLHTELGKMYSASEDLELAKQEFNLSLELKPDYSLAIIEKSKLLESGEESGEAVSLLEEFLKEHPLDIDAIFQLGRLYYNDNQIDKAISKLEKAVILSPNHSNALYTLGIAYNANGEKDKALSVLNRVLELNPNNQELRSKISEISK
ncbi:MAG: tetratricopeptide repeat protein, partial [Patescibacteria group bacterium]